MANNGCILHIEVLFLEHAEFIVQVEHWLVLASGLQIQVRAALAIIPDVVEEADLSKCGASFVALHEDHVH